MLIKRIISSVVGIIVLLSIVLSKNSLTVNFAVFIVILFALNELFHTVGISKKKPLEFLGYLGAAIICFHKHIADKSWIELIILIYITIMLLFLIIYYKKINFSDISLVFFSVIYIGYFLTHIVYIVEINHGYTLLWFIFLGAWATDTAAYFVGVLFGKHKLIEKISPKKTIEGSIGGVLGCIISFLFISLLQNYFLNLNINYGYISILAVICSILAQFGDLIASCIKRQYNIKDFGTIMPGHGGILDRFDSVILVTPAVYYFALFFEIL
jgi:phosphatidate cytidylyltransferase